MMVMIMLIFFEFVVYLSYWNLFTVIQHFFSMSIQIYSKLLLMDVF